jgi:hypothetical protein
LNLRPLRPELPAAATILVSEQGRVAHSPAGWQIAVVVLRYFVAVLMGWASGYEPLGECISAIDVLVSPIGLEPTTYGLREPSGCWRESC